MPHSQAKASEDGYDVFLSFCGNDTRHSFTDFLNDRLEKARIRVFMDGEIEVGDKISEKIVQGIRSSKIYIPIISQTYPDHKWCLVELAHIMTKVSLSKGSKKIFPIFYRVEPKHWIPHLKTFPSDVELKVFKEALANVGGIKGWKVEKGKRPIEILDKVVQKVLEVLGRNEESQTNGPIKLDDFTQPFENLLDCAMQRERGLEVIRFLDMPHSQAKASEDGYDVFLSFCGNDTRHSFTDFLNDRLEKARIRVFMDDGEIEVGDKISEKIVQGICSSKIYLPIISQTYPDHKWCLVELAHMMKKVSLSKGSKKIFPIFYRVEPGDVKHWIPHLKTFPSEVELKVFKEALANVGGIKGWKVEKGKRPIEILDKVVQKVLEVLGRKEESQTNGPIKLDDFTQQFENLVDCAMQRCTGRGRSLSRSTTEIARLQDLRMEGGSIGKGEIKGITSITIVESLHTECSEAREEQWKQ